MMRLATATVVACVLAMPGQNAEADDDRFLSAWRQVPVLAQTLRQRTDAALEGEVELIDGDFLFADDRQGGSAVAAEHIRDAPDGKAQGKQADKDFGDPSANALAQYR